MTSQFKVYLNRRFNDWSFEQKPENIAIGDRPVASITVKDGVTLGTQLDDVWAAAQHCNAVNEHGWPGRPEVTLCVRSLSIGDVVETEDGRYFAVNTVGFVEIEKPECCPHCGRSGGGGS